MVVKGTEDLKEIFSAQCKIEYSDSNAIIFFKTADLTFLKENKADQNVLFELRVDFFDEIEISKCSYKITKFNLEICLVKKYPNVKWPSVLKPNIIFEDDKNIKSESIKKDDKQSIKHKLNSPKNKKTSNVSSSKTTEILVDSSNRLGIKIRTQEVPNKAENSNYGFTGLVNLGNTCYMNAAIQLLVNLTEIRDYFIETTQLFKKEINTNNALGLNGKMAVQFAMLIRQIWTSNQKYISPSKLRDLICYKFSNFRGNEQQDTQEFMFSFLSLLHEDLNRVLKKPYYENSLECDTDSISFTQNIAFKSWQRFLSRENSVIVDCLFGQFKSKLTCPECQNTSITFEPFNNILVPLAKPKINFSCIIMFHFLKRQSPVKLNILLSENSTIQELFEIISLKFKDLKPNKLKAFNSNFINETDNFNEKDKAFMFTTEWELVSEKSTILENFKINTILVIYEILIDGDILEIKLEQLVKYPLKSMLSMGRCSYCSKTDKLEVEGAKKLPRCTKCYRSAYCNSECQKKDWIKHYSTLCSKPLDSVGVPALFSVYKNQIDSLESLKKILIDVGFCSIEINNYDLEKNMQISFLNELNGKNEKLENSDDFMKLISLKNKSVKIQLLWNNYGDSVVKTSLNKFNVIIEPVKQQTIVSLTDCLNLFTKPEKLSSENPWYCSKCEKHQEATKQMNIWRLPKYLIITLKRFHATKASDNILKSEYNQYMMMNPGISSILKNRVIYNKLNTEVSFPIRNLDMSKYVVNPNVKKTNRFYDLCGVINHFGQSLSLGHYTAYARTHDKYNTFKDEIGWRIFDDENVSLLEEKQIFQNQRDAYVLIYRVRDGEINEGSISLENFEYEPILEKEVKINDIDAPSEDEYYDLETDDSKEIKDSSKENEHGHKNNNKEHFSNNVILTQTKHQFQDLQKRPENLQIYTNLNDLD